MSKQKTPLAELIDFMRNLRAEGWSGDIREVINEANYLLAKERLVRRREALYSLVFILKF